MADYQIFRSALGTPSTDTGAESVVILPGDTLTIPCPMNGLVRYQSSKTLTATQIKALHATPQTLVGGITGSLIIVDRIVTKTTFAGAAFTGSNNVEFRYTDGSGTKVTADLPVADLNVSSGTALDLMPGTDLTTGAINPILSAAVVAAVPVANPGGSSATGTLEIITQYHIVTP